jgi:hypothetical protein
MFVVELTYIPWVAEKSLLQKQSFSGLKQDKCSLALGNKAPKNFSSALISLKIDHELST